MERRLIVATQDKYYLIPPEQILYIRTDGSYCHLVLQTGEDIRISKNLTYVSKHMPSGCDFLMRVHKSWMVNVNLIEYVQREKNRQFKLVLKGGISVPINSDERQQLIHAYATQIQSPKALKAIPGKTNN